MRRAAGAERGGGFFLYVVLFCDAPATIINR